MNFPILFKQKSIQQNKKFKPQENLLNCINKRIFLLVIASILFILSTNLISSPIEKIDPNTCKVFEIFQYEIEKQEGYEYNLPPLGDINSDEDGFSIGEVLSLKENGKTVVIKFRIFKSGTFSIPVSWKDLNTQETIPSKLKIEIRSSLAKDDDGQPAELEEPIEFGKFLWHRLIVVVFIFIGLGYLFYFLYNHYKKRPLDAILEIPNELTLDDILDSKWNHLINQTAIYKKHFAYFLTEMLQSKLQISHKFSLSKSDLSGFENGIEKTNDSLLQQATITDSILLEKIYQTLPIDLSKIREMKVFLLISKYTSNTETMEKEEAEKIYLEWKNLMNSIHKVKNND